ncbi:hypothetical protein GRJ2_000968500 [Grus japonensis]|uniref:Uncharacterized protein n=1 Tax=Grus japonensis TaxID=30415 RepID=A0ABC9WL20_GRUJA
MMSVSTPGLHQDNLSTKSPHITLTADKKVFTSLTQTSCESAPADMNEVAGRRRAQSGLSPREGKHRLSSKEE